MLSAEGNAGERWKTTIGLISKKGNSACAAHFFCTFLCRCFTRQQRETSTNFLVKRCMEKMSYVFSFTFFFTAAHFHLALVAASISYIVTTATKSLQKRKNSVSEESEGVWGGWGLRSSAAFPAPHAVHHSARFARRFPSCFIPFFAFFSHYAAWSQANVIMVLQ